MRDAFGIEKNLFTRAAKPVARVTGHGPGARLVPGARIVLKPRTPTSFVEYDAVKASQIKRGAMKDSFR